jgi:ribosome maturation factor RimP
MSDVIIDRVREFAESLLPSLGLELFDVQFRREGHGWVLRLIIDKPEGVSLDDCSRVSRETGDFLDVEDLIEQQYHLEVSSPGLERPLRSIAECRTHLGKKARFKLHKAIDSERVVVGRIERVEDHLVTVVTEQQKTYELDWSLINKARLAL